jgi:hypothetical protein
VSGLAALALVLVVSLSVVSRASALTPGVTWVQTTPPQNTPITLLEAITCSSHGNCVAVGEASTDASGNGLLPAVAIESNSVWSAPVITALPAGAQDGQLTGVSCTTATACVAVGFYENASTANVPLILPITVSGSMATLGTESSPALPTTPDPDPATDETSGDQQASFNGVSCTATACTAVGDYIPQKDSNQAPMTATGTPGGTWTTSEVSQLPTGGSIGSGASLQAVSCPTGGPCEAVGYYVKTADSNSYPWAIQLDGLPGVAVSLPSDFSAEPATPLPGYAGFVFDPTLDSISCPSAGACVAAGTYPASSVGVGVAVPISLGSPGTPIELTSSTSPLGTDVTGISCIDTQDCQVIAVGRTSASTTLVENASETAGVWSSFAMLPSPSPASIPLGISCQTLELCVSPVGVANVAPGGGEGPPSLAFETSAGTVATSNPPLPGATVGQPYSAQLTASGGTGQFTWSITGALPAGLSLDPVTGIISGTPTGSGQTAFTATVADSGPPAQTATETDSITVTAPPSAPAPAAPAPTVTPPAPAPVVTAPTPTAKSLVRISSLKVSGTTLTVGLLCTGTTQCSGLLKLIGVEHLKGKTATAVTALLSGEKKVVKTTTKTLTFVSKRYSIKAGHIETLKLTLTGQGLKLLKQFKKMGAQVTVTPTGAKKASPTKNVSLKAPVVKKKVTKTKPKTTAKPTATSKTKN